MTQLTATIYMTPAHQENCTDAQFQQFQVAVRAMMNEMRPHIGIVFRNEEHPSIEAGLARGTIRADIECYYRVFVTVDTPEWVNENEAMDIRASINHDVFEACNDAADAILGVD